MARKKTRDSDEAAFLVAVADDNKTVFIAPAVPAIVDADLAKKIKNYKPTHGSSVAEYSRVLVATGTAALVALAGGTLHPPKLRRRRRG